ncbi:MAG: hypothetical protein O6944_02725, partial [Gammaproteobacteria bacterium]|nr:hypothetical protein [Gammaproteobacteria bacterium]
EDALGRQAAVALIGPRQVGKTTLALEDIQPKKAFLVYSGTDRFPKRQGLEAISVREVVKELHSLKK